MKLYVGNLSKDINDAQLTDLMLPFGKPESVSIILDRDSGQSKGFGFVEMSKAGEAQAAIAGLDGKEIKGLALKVNEARPPKGKQTGGSAGPR